MSNFIFAIVLLTISVAAVAVRKTYYYIPAHELKRQAEKGKAFAKKLYPAVAYGDSLRALLWVIFAVSATGGIVLLARNAPVTISEVIIIGLIWALFSWVPASKLGKIGSRLTLLVTPAIVWLLDRLHPVLSRLSGLVQKGYSAPRHTGLFERSDLISLIDKIGHQTDSRFTEEELLIAKQALSFDEHTVADILTVRKKIGTVLASETVGPIVIDELHKSNQEYVLVRESTKGPIVGSIELRTLGLHSSGLISTIMDKKIYYVHENDTLGEALHAFYTTNHPLFVVTNSSEEYLGIITVENILRQLLVHVPGDEFDQYSDISAVAARHPRIKKTETIEKLGDTDDEFVVEVVE